MVLSYLEFLANCLKYIFWQGILINRNENTKLTAFQEKSKHKELIKHNLKEINKTLVYLKLLVKESSFIQTSNCKLPLRKPFPPLNRDIYLLEGQVSTRDLLVVWDFGKSKIRAPKVPFRVFGKLKSEILDSILRFCFYFNREDKIQITD